MRYLGLALLLAVAAVYATPAAAQFTPGDIVLNDPLDGSTSGVLVGNPPPAFIGQLTAGPPAVAAFSNQGLYNSPGATGAAVAYSLALPSAGTLSFRLTVAAPASQWGITGIFGHEGTGANADCDDFFLQTAGSALDFGMFSAPGGGSVRNVFPVSWNVGEFHHIVVTWGPNATPIVYIDGVANQTTGTPGPFIAQCGDTPFLFANSRVSITAGFNSGAFIYDDLLLLNRPLSAAELALLEVVPFAAFDAKVEVELGPLANDDEFEVKGTFTLGAGSDGIDPLTEIVALELSGGSVTYSTTIPAGSFEFRPAKPGKKGKLGKPAEFRFEGVIDGVALEVKIADLGVGMFEFKAEGKGADLAGIANPVTVQLTIGDDSGSTTVEAEFE